MYLYVCVCVCVCLCLCVCVCDLKDLLHKECLYLYTSGEDPCGRSQYFDTDLI